MKRLLCMIIMLGGISGCARPVIIGNDTHSRVFTPCANDSLCFRDTYNIAWDSTCSHSLPDFPVSYRSKQSEYQSSRVEYILKPNPVELENRIYGGGK